MYTIIIMHFQIPSLTSSLPSPPHSPHSLTPLTPTLPSHPHSLTPTLPSHRPHTLPQESPDDALRIFTEDIVEVESLPRQLVLDHLTSVATDLTMPYLVSAWDVCEIKFISLKTQTMVWV